MSNNYNDRNQLGVLFRCVVLLLFVSSFKTGRAQLTFTVINNSGTYSITCNNSVISLSASSNATPAVNYTWTHSSSLPVFGSQALLTVPGVYTVSASSGSLTAAQTFTVFQNTAAPTLSISGAGQVLSCNIASILVLATSNTQGAIINWGLPIGSSTSTAGTLTALAKFNVSPTNTINGMFTLTVIDPTNQCQKDSVIKILQNIFKPQASIITNYTAVTCNIPTLVLTNASATGIPPGSVFSHTLPVIAHQWSGPVIFSNTAICQVTQPGTYTMIAKDLNNGCTNEATLSIGDKRIYPWVQSPGIFTIACPGGTVTLIPSISSGTQGMVFSWKTPPGATTSGLNDRELTTDTPGDYTLVATYTVSGCSTHIIFGVWACLGNDENSRDYRTLKIFPNPVINRFHLIDYVAHEENWEIKIYKVSGQQVLKQQVNINIPIDASCLEPGVYFAEINLRNQVYRCKLIKEEN